MYPANPLDTWTADRLGRGSALLTRAELQNYQLRQLRETLAWAKARSPFYRNRLGAIDEAMPGGLDDLRRLPLTTADDLRRNDPPLLCVSQSEISRVVTIETSGTRGVAKRLFFTAREQLATVDFFDHGMRLLARAGDRVLILFPGERPGSVGDLLTSALSRLGATPILLGWPQNLETAAVRLRREQPDVVVGAPVPLLALARHAATRDGPPIRVKRALLSADHAAESVRQGLADLWNCEVFEHYGMTEMGLGGGIDCASHSGYHMRESELLIEIIDPASGQPVAVGEPGEVVFTTLTRLGMPLIRYRTGDLSRLLPGTCACGSPLVRLERIHRRLGAEIRPGGTGELTIGTLDETMFRLADVTDFVATFDQGPPPALHIDVTRVAREGLSDESLAASVHAALAALPNLGPAHATTGLRLSVSIAPEHELPRRTGKRMISGQNPP